MIDLARISEELLRSELGRRNAAKRTTYGAGTGRPRSTDRCPCGRYTVTTAGKRNHRCSPLPPS